MLEYFYKVIKISPYSNGVEHPTVSANVTVLT